MRLSIEFDEGRCAMLIKEPIAVYLEEKQLEALKVMAASQKISLDELVRKGVARLLEETSIEDDPLWNIVGMFDSGLGDLAENHDKYLVEAYSDTHEPDKK